MPSDAPKPTGGQNPADHYIDAQIQRTRRTLRWVDAAAAVLQLAVAALVTAILLVVLEHWGIGPGGFSEWTRAGLFGSLALATCWFCWTRLLPVLTRPVNPMYAADAIEKHAPQLKNSLLNLLYLRKSPERLPAAVLQSLHRQTAKGLSTAGVESAVDRVQVIRLGYVLLGLTIMAVLYSALSPKSSLTTLARVAAPWASIAPPSRVRIARIEPGHIQLTQGESVAVAADIVGLAEGEEASVVFSTADGQVVDRRVPMTVSESGLRFSTPLPPPRDPQTLLGLQQPTTYRIEAGDARSLTYTIEVAPAPTIALREVRYDYPDYTGFVDRTVSGGGDLSAIEGTRVTLRAEANSPIERATIDFEVDGVADLTMLAEGNGAVGKFVLELREDRRTPRHNAYALRLTDGQGRSNERPARWRIEVTPDLPPEVGLTEPKALSIDLPLNGLAVVRVEARDPDFALNAVRLKGRGVSGPSAGQASKAGQLSSDGLALDVPLLRQPGAKGPVEVEHRLEPSVLGLRAGDVLEYWAVATDNRAPEPNVATTERRRVRVVAPGPRAPGDQQLAQNDPKQDPNQQDQGEGRQGEAGGEGQQGEGQQGEAAPGQNNASEGAASGAASKGEGQPQQQGEDDQQQPESDPDSAADKGSGGGEGMQQPDEQQKGEQQKEQKEGENGGGGLAAHGEQGEKGEKGEQGAQGQAGSAAQGEQSGESPPQDGAQGGATQGGAKGSAASQPNNPNNQQPSSEPVSANGEDDASAFQRIRNHLNQQQQKPKSGQGSKNQDPQGKQADQQSQGDPSTGEPNTGEQKKPQGGEAPPQKGQPSGDQNGSAKPDPQGEAQAEGAPPEKAGAEPQSATAKPSGGQTSQGKQQQGAGQQGQQPQDSAAQGPGAQGPGSKALPQDPNKSSQQPEGAEPQPESAGGQQQNPKGEPGAGADSKPQGSPTTNQEMKPRDKPSGDAGGSPKKEPSNEPPMASRSGQESDSQSDAGGDRSGGGEEGGGQQAPRQGTGSAGQNQAADEGAGSSADRGPGDSLGGPGGDKPSQQSPTGGAQQKQPGGTSAKPSDASDPTGGKQGSQEENPTQKSAGDLAQPQSGEPNQPQPGQSDAGKAPQGESQGGNPGQDSAARDQPQQPGEQQQGSREGTGGGGNPQGGGEVGDPLGPPPAGVQTEEDAANLDYARKQTDLVLETLEKQLRDNQVDAELLEQLGWTTEDLRSFVNRWQATRQAASRPGATAEERSRLDAALRSLGLRPTRLAGETSRKEDNLRDLNEAYRGTVPPELRDRLRAFNEGVSRPSTP